MGRKVLEVSNLGKKKLISTLCSLLLVVTGIFATTAFAACSTTAQQNVQVTPTPAQRGRTEAPETDHGAQVNKQAQTHLQKNPWGVAVDNAHGFIWVAEPGCDFPEVNVKCPTAFPGMIAKFSLADGTLLGEYAQPTGYSSPAFVAVDNTGNIWFSEPTTDAIGKLSLVGVGMKSHTGVAGKMFEVLAREGVNIEMISQGSSEINISCVIDEKNADKALDVIHDELLSAFVA